MKLASSQKKKHEEMSGWLEDYLLRDVKEKMKHNSKLPKYERSVRVRRLRENPKSSSTRLSLKVLRMKSWRRMTHFFRSCSSVLIR